MKKNIAIKIKMWLGLSVCLLLIMGGCKSTKISHSVKNSNATAGNSISRAFDKIGPFEGFLADSNTNARLIFRSGFNEGVYLTKPVYNPGTRGLFTQMLKGTDTVSGFTWPIDSAEFDCESPAVLFMLAAGPRGQAIPDPGIYMENKLVMEDGYDGKPTRVLYNAYYHDMPGGGGGGQNWQYIYPDYNKEVTKELYFRYRLKFPDSLKEKMMKDDPWRNFFFFKTKSTAWRNEGGIRYKNGKFYWRVAGSYLPQDAPRYTTVWEIINDDYPVPFGKWFTVEVYWNVSEDPGKGRLFWSVNGHVIADYHGINKRTNNNIDRIGTFGNYGTDSPQWIDDYEMWSAPPCKELPCIVKQPESSNYNIISRHSGKVMDLGPDVSKAVQYPYNNAAAQQWKIIEVGNDFYKIINQKSGKALDVEGASTNNAARVVLSDYTGAEAQQWKFVGVGEGYYKIVNRNSGQSLNVKGEGIKDGALIIQYPYKNETNSQWRIYEAGIVALGDYETGDASQWYSVKGLATVPENCVIDSIHVRQGKYSAKFVPDNDNNLKGTSGERTVLSSLVDLVEWDKGKTVFDKRARQGSEYYYAWSTMLSGKSLSNLKGAYSFMELHDIPSNLVPPLFSFYYSQNGGISLKHFDQNTQILNHAASGVWQDFVLHIKWSWDNDGEVQVWHKVKDSSKYTLVLDLKNIPTLHEFSGNCIGAYFVQGNYHGPNDDKVVLYQDGMAVGTTFEAVVAHAHGETGF